MKPVAKLILLTVLGLSLAGCSLLESLREPPEPTAPAESDPPSRDGIVSDADLPWLLAYYRDMEGLSEQVIEREQLNSRAGLEAGRCNAPRLQLALVLLRGLESGLRPEVPEDLLRPCLEDPLLANSGIQHFAFMLQGQISRAGAAQVRSRAAVQELESLKRENAELKRQVEGLKAIERSLQDRRRRQVEESNGPTR